MLAIGCGLQVVLIAIHHQDIGAIMVDVLVAMLALLVLLGGRAALVLPRLRGGATSRAEVRQGLAAAGWPTQE